MQCGGGVIQCTGCELDTPLSGCQSETTFDNWIGTVSDHPVVKCNFTLTTGRRGVRFTAYSPDDTHFTLHPVVIIQTG